MSQFTQKKLYRNFQDEGYDKANDTVSKQQPIQSPDDTERSVVLDVSTTKRSRLCFKVTIIFVIVILLSIGGFFLMKYFMPQYFVSATAAVAKKEESNVSKSIDNDQPSQTGNPTATKPKTTTGTKSVPEPETKNTNKNVTTFLAPEPTAPAPVNTPEEENTGVAISKKVSSYILPEWYYTQQPDLTTIKGKYNRKEAYAFTLCTREYAGPEAQRYIDALKINIYRLLKLQGHERDILVMACSFTPAWQFRMLSKMDVTLVNIESISPDRPLIFPNWKDVMTKLRLWKCIHWDKILLMDIDIFFQDNFLDIWNHTALEPVTTPPAGYTLDDTYHGYKLKDLYPYVMAGAFDSWNIVRNRQIKYLNGGLVALKPNLAHYNMLLDMAYDKSVYLDSMDQAELNIIYNVTGPLPWKNFDEWYNYAPSEHPLDDRVKGYHCKIWAWIIPALTNKWTAYFEEMKSKLFNVSITPDANVEVLSNKNSITIKNLKLSSQEGALYYWADTNLANALTREQIREKFVESNKINTKITSDSTVDLVVGGLIAGTTYRISYFADSNNYFAPTTDVYFIEHATTS